jgi:4-diphosphocytidyl-2-C-methyl-D-erythritol kinase
MGRGLFGKPVSTFPAHALVEEAPAKVNLTLRVLGRRSDGYHELESLVAFANIGDQLSLAPTGELALTVTGPSAAQAGVVADNLVVKAAHALRAQIPDLVLGSFELEKRLPVAAGLGGGSADAAAALRLLARANGLAADDARVYDAACATGADVPVCLEPRVRLMRGIGEVLSAPLDLPPLDAVLINPGVALATKAVFAGWRPQAREPVPLHITALAKLGSRAAVTNFLATQANDLEEPAIALVPIIADVLAASRAEPGCTLARMSGSGSTCFALFASATEAAQAASVLQSKHSSWWVRACSLGNAG